MAEAFRQHAFVRRRQMQDHHKRHAAVGGHVIEETTKRVGPAGRGADANDRKFRPSTHRPRQSIKFPTIRMCMLLFHMIRARGEEFL